MSITTTEELLGREQREQAVEDELKRRTQENDKIREMTKSHAEKDTDSRERAFDQEVEKLANPSPGRPIPAYRQGGIDPDDFIMSHGFNYAAGRVVMCMAEYRYARDPIQALESARYQINLLLEQEKSKDGRYTRTGKKRRTALRQGWQEDRERVDGIKDLSNPEKGTPKI